MKSRNDKSIQSFWGTSTQHERLNACFRYSSNVDKILDIGCARGAYSTTLNQKGYFTIGVDINFYQEWIDLKTTDFLIASGLSLPFKDKFFDVTISFEVIEHCIDPIIVLNEMRRCTKKYIIISVPNCDLNNNLRKYDLAMAHWTDPTHCNFFTKDSIASLLKDQGFEIIEISDCYPIYPNNYFWDTLKLPKLLSFFLKKIFQKLQLVEIYYSSILIVASVSNRGDHNDPKN